MNTPALLTSFSLIASFSALLCLYFALISAPLNSLQLKNPIVRLITERLYRARNALGALSILLGTIHGILLTSFGVWLMVVLFIACVLLSPFLFYLIRSWPRILYALGLFTLIHVYMVGSHFETITSPVSLAFSIALIALLLLHIAKYTKQYLQSSSAEAV